MRNRYRPGDHYVTCDRTGFKIRRSEAVMQWDKMLVRADTAEPRHPQDFVRGRTESIAVEDSRSRWNTDTFLDPNDVTQDSL